MRKFQNKDDIQITVDHFNQPFTRKTEIIQIKRTICGFCLWASKCLTFFEGILSFKSQCVSFLFQISFNILKWDLIHYSEFYRNFRKLCYSKIFCKISERNWDRMTVFIEFERFISTIMIQLYFCLNYRKSRKVFSSCKLYSMDNLVRKSCRLFMVIGEFNCHFVHILYI